MSEKRKDNIGRILRDGESQRKDGRYMYRYTDLHGKRACVYAQTLDQLRDKEKAISKDMADGIDFASGEISIGELLDMYLSSKSNIRHSTFEMYQSVISTVKATCQCSNRLRTFKKSDAKRMMVDLQNAGKSYSYIELIKKVLSAAFKLAVEDGVIRTNPFLFALSEVLQNESAGRTSLTEKEKLLFLDAAKDGLFGKRHYDEVVLLLHTGMRISELYGLTLNDVDLKERCISINKQLLYRNGLYIERPKTSSGTRVIPIADQATYDTLCNIISNRKRCDTEWIVDGYTGFLFVNSNGSPKTSSTLQRAMQTMIERYNATHTQKLPKITPHILRHTYCTDMISRGVDPKTVQYLLGHSNISVTMNVYTHMDYERAKAALMRVSSL